MDREFKRQVGALVLATSRNIEAQVSTYPATVHADADMMEYLTLEGGDTFRDYTAEERRRMAKAGQALPDGSFPIANCADAENAIHAVGRAKDVDKTKSFIKRRVRALNCSGSVFENWK